jgi:hypothetical protein
LSYTPQLLTARYVATKAKEAYAAGKLGANIPNNKEIGCRYAYGEYDGAYAGYHCGVGCALNKEALAKVIAGNMNRDSVDSLVDAGVVCYGSSDDFSDVMRIQFAHDNVCSASDPRSRANALKKFRRLLDKHVA